MTDPFIITAGLWGGDREAVAPNAAKSALPVTDHFVFIDTGPSAQRAIEATVSLLGVDGRCAVVRYPGEYGWCCDGRNFCLDAAHSVAVQLGHTTNVWCFWIDTDEVLELNGTDVRSFLSSTDADAVTVRMSCQQYPKAKFIRLPANGRFVDRVHEMYEGSPSIVEMPGVCIRELDKPREERIRRNLAIRRICEQWIAEEPGYGRAWMLLANTYVFEEELDYARAASIYTKAATLMTNNEHRAWAFFKAAGCMFEMGRYAEALELCCDGMKSCAYFPELPYLAAAAAAHRGNNEQNDIFSALGFANWAITIGEQSPLPMVLPLRMGFRLPIALWEGPWEIRHGVLNAMGMAEMAAEAQRMMETAKAARLGVKT